MVNVSPMAALSHLMLAYGKQIKKKDRQTLTLMTLDSDPCHLVSNVVNDSPMAALSHWLLVYGKQIKKDRQTLTLMTFDPDPCHLVPMWLMTLLWLPCHTGCLCMVNK